MTQNLIILLFSISALSPFLGILATKLFKSGGDSAGKGIVAVIAIFLFMFIASLAGGITSSILWASSKDPLPLWAKALTILTYLAPYIFVAITELLLPAIKKKIKK